jgi:parvulin-like peptidyl-prolyl isomerase
MVRRERTTGLPRPHKREKTALEARRFAGITWTDRRLRWLIVGGAVVLLLAVLGAIAYRVYDDKIGRPNSVVLTVGNEKFTLGYFTDRLYQFAQANQSSSTTAGILEQDLLNKLQEEALTEKLAAEKGITISENDITKSIADSLGVPPGGSGSSFDTLYRQRLATLKISDSNYRKLTRASVANDKLLALAKKDVGNSGEQFVIRSAVVDSKDKAEAVLQQVKGGADLGSIAQTESVDLTGRGQDGLMDAQPLSLLPDAVQPLVKDAKAGDLLGPVQVDSNWWVFRIEKRQTANYTDDQKNSLAQNMLDKWIADERAKTTIKPSLSSSDSSWAISHAG